jgi:RNA polymerase sigma-70 factor, ECF subfamily
LHDEIAELLPSAFRFAYRLCRDRHLAEDLAQDAALRMVKSDTTFVDQQSRRLWIFRVIKNLWIDWIRNQRRKGNLVHSQWLDTELQDEQTVSVIEVQEQVEIAKKAMLQLPDRQQSVLHLIANEQLTISEVAEVLSISSSAVKASLSLARTHMRQMMLKANAMCSSRKTEK